MGASLVGIRAKLDRAKKHLDEFDAVFLTGDSPVATNVKLESVEEKPEGRLCVLAITSGDVPPELGIPAGDAVHNLRSSLDHLLCQLAILAGNAAACDKTQFPIFAEDTPDNRKRIKRWIKHVSPAAQAVIESLQPYERRKTDPFGDLLWMLSELDNIDKHRLLLVARPHFNRMRIAITIDGETRYVAPSNHPQWRSLKFGTEPLLLRLTVPWDNTRPKTEVEVKAEPTVGIVFQQTGLKCDGADVRTTVGNMITDVTSIVNDFDAKFFR